jgi:hypothetical protein
MSLIWGTPELTPEEQAEQAANIEAALNASRSQEYETNRINENGLVA